MNRCGFPLMLVLYLVTNDLLFSQASTSDCIGAIPVCQQIYTEENAPSGPGDTNDIGFARNCNPEEKASTWYIFTVNETGRFGFVLTPNAPSDDYDWALYNVTNADCNDIRNNADLLVSCNAAGSEGNGPCNGATGATGDNSFDIQGLGCDNFNPGFNDGQSPFNDLVDVQKGETYVLLVQNYTPFSVSGYTIDFGLSAEIGIFDDVPPLMEDLEYIDDCTADAIKVNFSEPILCSTISPDNFNIEGPNAPYAITLDAPNCGAGGDYTNNLILNISPAIESGTTIAVELTVDEQTQALDICGNPAINQRIEVPNFSPAGNLSLGPDTTVCPGDPVFLDATLEGGSYIWNDGNTDAQRTVTTSGTYIVDVTYACGVLSDTINIFAAGSALNVDLGPDQEICSGETILLDATASNAQYLWSDNSTNPTLEVSEAGVYSVTITSSCGEATDEITISAPSQITVTIEDGEVCATSPVTWDVTIPNGMYLWEDGSTSPVRTVSEPGNYAVTVSDDCQSVELSAELTDSGTSVPMLEIPADTTLCLGETLTLNGPGNSNISVTWPDGSTGTSFTITTAGTYSFNLMNECGTSADQTILVNFIEDNGRISLGQDTVICPGTTIMLDATLPGAISYQWQDNSTKPEFLATTPGQYAVFIETECGSVNSSITLSSCQICSISVPNVFSPNGDGTNDVLQPFFSCPVNTFSLTVFDRWGAQVYSTSDPNTGWDGKDASNQALRPGTYVWVIEAVIEENGNPKTFNEFGDILIVR